MQVESYKLPTWSTEDRRSRYVYFIQETIGRHAPIKIGVAINVQQRLKDLQTSNPRQLEIYTVLGPMIKMQAFDVEKRLHHKFRRHHIRGEWFSGVIKQQFSELSENSYIEVP